MFDFLEKLDLKSIGKVISLINPVAGIVIQSIDAIVKSENESISNDSTVKVLESISRSTGNNVDDELLAIVKAHLDSKA